MFTRYATAITSGTVMTFGLLFLMQLLISLQPGAIGDPTTSIGVDWIKLKTRDPLIPPPEEPIDKEKLTKSDPPPERPSSRGKGEPVFVFRSGPVPPPKYGLPRLTELSDGPLVALVRVSPEYPPKTRALGLDGWVIVEFDVTELGYVSNVEVVESSNKLFNKAAITAAQRFKFKAQVINGQAQPSYGVRNKFTFRMEDQ